MSSQGAAVEFLCEQFCEAFGSVFEQTAGESYVLNRSEVMKPADGNEILSYALVLKGKVNGTIFVQVDLHSASVLATRLMGSPIDSSISYLPEHEDALFEIVSQTAGGMATALRTRFGEAEVGVERKKGSSTASSVMVNLESATDSDSVSIGLLADEVLCESITACLSGLAQPTSSPLQDSSAPAAHDPSAENQNLRLIMDVELDLTLRFGQRILMLSEVADLATGSVVELDRVVDEPVELLLGERVIARGEVVIVDGNYGLRITELSSIDQSVFLTA
jgi:flagellar motor switch protein FliN/FliY